MREVEGRKEGRKDGRKEGRKKEREEGRKNINHLPSTEPLLVFISHTFQGSVFFYF